MIHDAVDDYLWDCSGKPDERIRLLESLLSRYRYEPVTDDAPGSSAEDRPGDASGESERSD